MNEVTLASVDLYERLSFTPHKGKSIEKPKQYIQFSVFNLVTVAMSVAKEKWEIIILKS